ncbi:MFS transporter [Curtobacterium flaccumfaciens]|nr:MFS transporter [Curtobacterium flaccumfaciens]
MTTPPPDSPLIAAAVPTELTPTTPAATAEREPRGFAASYFAASVGIYLAIFAPVLGGLSVKIQSLVPLERASTELGLVTGTGRSSPSSRSRWSVAFPTGPRRVPACASRGSSPARSAPSSRSSASDSHPTSPSSSSRSAAPSFFSNFAQAALTATVADQVPERRRGRISGLVGASSSIGILIGALGLSLLPTDLLRSLVPGAIGLVAGLVFAFTLKDRVLQRTPGGFDVKAFLASFVFNPRTHRNLGWAWLTKALIMFGYAAVTSYLTLFLATSFGMKPVEQLQWNLYATIVSVVFTVSFSILGGVFSDRLGRRRSFVTTGGVLIGIGTGTFVLAAVVGSSAGLVVVLVAEAIIGAGAGMFLAVDTALCIAVLPNPDDTAKDLGVLNIANTLPQTIAPFLAGIAIIPLGSALFGNGYSLWFAFAGAVAVVGALLVYRIKGVR